MKKLIRHKIVKFFILKFKFYFLDAFDIIGKYAAIIPVTPVLIIGKNATFIKKVVI